METTTYFFKNNDFSRSFYRYNEPLLETVLDRTNDYFVEYVDEKQNIISHMIKRIDHNHSLYVPGSYMFETRGVPVETFELKLIKLEGQSSLGEMFLLQGEYTYKVLKMNEIHEYFTIRNSEMLRDNTFYRLRFDEVELIGFTGIRENDYHVLELRSTISNKNKKRKFIQKLHLKIREVTKHKITASIINTDDVVINNKIVNKDELLHIELRHGPSVDGYLEDDRCGYVKLVRGTNKGYTKIPREDIVSWYRDNTREILDLIITYSADTVWIGGLPSDLQNIVLGYI